MSSIAGLLASKMAGEGVAGLLSSKLGIGEDQSQKAISAAVPLLLKALAKNAQSDAGPDLAGALDKDHDGSILENIAGHISGDNASMGTAILGHVLGGRQGVVEAGIGKMAGLDGEQSGQVLAALAPLVMGAIGKQKKESGLGVEDLSSLLGQETKQADDGPAGSVFNQLLDSDGDGNIGDDLGELGGQLLKNFF